MPKRKKYIEPTPCMIVELHSDSNDAIYTTICKTNDIEYCKKIGRMLWKLAKKPYIVKVKSNVGKVLWEYK